MNTRPAAPAPRLIDMGMRKVYALDLSDPPDANTADPLVPVSKLDRNRFTPTTAA